MSDNKRKRKAPARLNDNAFTDSVDGDQHKWCTVVCLQSYKKFLCKFSDIEDYDGGVLSSCDVQPGRIMVWKTSKGSYQVKVMKIHDKKPSRSEAFSERKERQVEDTSPSEDEENLRSSESGNEMQPHKKSKSTSTSKQCPIDTNEPTPETTSVSSRDVPGPSCSAQEKQMTTSQYLEYLPTINSTLLEIRDMMKAFLQNQVSTHLEKNDLSASEQHFTTETGINLLSLKASDPGKYALNLMQALFTDQEMASCCYKKIPGSRSDKDVLPSSKVALLEECIDKVFGKGTSQKQASIITKKCNQKCLDVRSKKLKRTTTTEQTDS